MDNERKRQGGERTPPNEPRPGRKEQRQPRQPAREATPDRDAQREAKTTAGNRQNEVKPPALPPDTELNPEAFESGQRTPPGEDRPL